MSRAYSSHTVISIKHSKNEMLHLCTVTCVTQLLEQTQVMLPHGYIVYF